MSSPVSKTKNLKKSKLVSRTPRKNSLALFRQKIKDLDNLFYFVAEKITHQTKAKNKVQIRKTKKSKKIILPLYFGWQLIIMISRAEDWQKHVIAPFKSYWQYITVVAVLIVFASTSIFIYQSNLTKAATYNFLQTDWSGGATINNATHSSDQNNWSEYISKDSNITAGTEITIAEAITTLTETSDTDFNAGATSTAEITGSGDSAYVALSSAAGSDGISDSYQAQKVVVSSSYAYIADSTEGLKIMNISDPANPSLEGSVDTGTTNYAVAVYGNYVYVDDYTNNQFNVVNITDKSTPVVANTIATLGDVRDMETVGDILYVLTSESGCAGYCASTYVTSYNLTDPSAPSLLGQSAKATNFGGGMDVEGNYVYISTALDYYFGIAWADISDPSNIGAWTIDKLGTTPDSSEDLKAIGQYIYYTNSTAGVRVYATSSQAVVETYNTAGQPHSFDKSGNILYVADGIGGLVALDISDPLNITLSNTYATTRARDVYISGSYAYVADYSDGLRAIAIPAYVSSGIFTSQILDTSANSGFGNISWTENLPSGTSISMKVRSDSSSDMSGATAWASCTAVTSGVDISSNGCVTDGQRYIQYQATLATTDSGNTPQLQDISIQYNSYTNGSLLGSAFDTEDVTNVMGIISWTESGTGDVQLQVRTAPDSGGSPDWASGSGWCGPSDCAVTTGDADYATTYYATSGASINSDQQAGSDDQWFQYRLWLTSADNSTTPTFSDLTISYVVNAPPDFESQITASQASDGLITIDYSVRDVDTGSVGAATPYEITPSFQYSTDNGANWYNITTGLSANATSTQTVAEGAYNSYQLTWAASEQNIDVYSTQTKIKVIVDDSEAANNTASSTSASFTMDASPPATGGTPIYLVATTTPASLVLDASDDTALEMCISLDDTESNCVSYASTATISLATDPDTAYVKFRDAYSNITSASAVTPETPVNMIIRDLSNVSSASTTPEYRLFVSWAAVSTPLVDFARYEVWHSTDGSSYELLSSITDKTINYYLHDDLVADSTHYYKVYTVDNDGNTSYFSTVVSDSANGQGGTDASPPTISSVSVGSIGTQSAVVTWTTDELSDSTVGYSTSAGNFDDETGVASMVTSHSVTLSGLTPNTTYYLRAKSADPDTNEASDSNGGDGYSFATLDGPAISNTSASIVQNTSATITWNTDEASDSTVYYSTNSDMSGAMSSNDSSSVTEHSITLADLTSGTRYYFYVTSGVGVDNNGGEYYYFNTTSDATAPVITSVEASIVTDTDAVITWSTDEGATSRVAYGLLTGVYTGYTTTTSSYNTDHSVTLSSLSNNTPYYYKVVSADAAGNTSTSTNEYSFTTLEKLSEESEVVAREEVAQTEGANTVSCGGGGSSRDTTAPNISDIVVTTSSDQINISWATNENAISILNYGIDATEENSITNPQTLISPTKKHSITITDLIPNVTYIYEAIAIDNGGNLRRSEIGTFNSSDFIVNLGGNSTSTDSQATDESFNNTLDQVAQYFKKMSNEVSISTLEGNAVRLIDDIASIIPPPIISGEPALTIGPNSASISWNTDDDANALVSYATENYYLDNNAYKHTIGNPDSYLSGVHKVDITGLDPETIYHYSIISRKPAGSKAQSRDFIFTTIPELAEIENYTTEILSPEEVTFKWITTVPTDSNLKYTAYRDGKLDPDSTRTESNEIFTTIHNVTVGDLEAGVIYQVELFGETTSGNNINQIISSFATSNDNLAPIIKQVKTDAALSLGKETKVQAIISWYTNEPSTSRVYYEQGAGRSDEDLTQASPMDENFSRHHVVVVTNFNPGSIYRFQVESTDGEGNASRSRTYTILTPKQQESVFQVIMRNVESTFGWLQVFR